MAPAAHTEAAAEREASDHRDHKLIGWAETIRGELFLSLCGRRRASPASIPRPPSDPRPSRLGARTHTRDDTPHIGVRAAWTLDRFHEAGAGKAAAASRLEQNATANRLPS